MKGLLLIDDGVHLKESIICPRRGWIDTNATQNACVRKSFVLIISRIVVVRTNSPAFVGSIPVHTYP